MNEKQEVYVGAKVPAKLKDEVSKAVENGRFMTESELFRQALRALLDELKEEA